MEKNIMEGTRTQPADLEGLLRPTADKRQEMLFDMAPDWRNIWWGMPEFEMKNVSPQYKITMNFMTARDMTEFAEITGCPLTTNSKSAWYPHQQMLEAGKYEYHGPPTDSRYPICIPSKGRADCQKTGLALDKMGTSYRFFVEETEGDDYKKHLGEDKVIVMPFHDLDRGSVPARNFIWEWAKEREHKRHWTVDDNINSFGRTHNNRRLNVKGGGFFLAMEDFVDRYENVVMAGPHNRGFVPDRSDALIPYIFNRRVYSCILLDTSMDIRWRGKYNEDTDLSLRLMKEGLCTLLFRALHMDKGATHGSKSKALKGGNTDNVYNAGDHRMGFVDSLIEQHPDVASLTWRWNRWHHDVDYSAFKKNKPIVRAGIVPRADFNNYEMTLVENVKI